MLKGGASPGRAAARPGPFRVVGVYRRCCFWNAAHASAGTADPARRMSMGNLGDWKSVGSGVLEMRIVHGPGYRVYFVRRGDYLIIILAGGTKRTQAADILRAREIAEALEG